MKLLKQYTDGTYELLLAHPDKDVLREIAQIHYATKGEHDFFMFLVDEDDDIFSYIPDRGGKNV